MKGLYSLLALPLLSAASPFVRTDVFDESVAPLHEAPNAKHIPDSYLVVFKKHVTQSLAIQHHSWVSDLHDSIETKKMELRKRSQIPMVDSIFEGLKYTYDIQGGLLGYAGHFDRDVIEHVRKHPDVELVERDQEVRIQDSEEQEEDGSALEKNAPWGLARLSHRDGLTFGTFNKYLYSSEAGEGVDVYVIDTGANIDHVDLEGRARWGKTFVPNEPDEDGNGHGSHCSGTVAGKKYGVAKKANVVAVKVLAGNGSGTMSGVVKGVEYAATEHAKAVSDAKKGKRKGFKGSAANMSLGGSTSKILERAVDAAVDVGIHFAVAAGNDNADACSYSPAAAEKPVTVGASTLADERAFFSNYGKCTDIFAPGLNIQSIWKGSPYAVNTISGTSMASPHIAGLLAYMLSLQPAHDSAYAVAEIDPQELKANLIAVATRNVLTDMPEDTPNVLAWNGGGSSNYTDIVAQGSYDGSNTRTKTQSVKSASVKVAEQLERELARASPLFQRSKDNAAGEMAKIMHEVVDEVIERMERVVVPRVL